MRAVILAGGKGTRLRPYTMVLPKPLLPVGDRPVLEIIIQQLANQGFKHITLTVNHQAELIKAYFGNGEKWNVFIDYSMERKLLGTAGPLTLIKDLPEDFLVMNGDILTDLNLGDFLEGHQTGSSALTVACKSRSAQIEYGVFKYDSNGEIISFEEKPTYHYHANMGVYAVNRKVLSFIPTNDTFGFDQVIDKMLLEHDVKPRVCLHKGYWLDIGKPDDYAQAIEEFEGVRSLLPGEKVSAKTN